MKEMLGEVLGRDYKNFLAVSEELQHLVSDDRSSFFNNEEVERGSHSLLCAREEPQIAIRERIFLLALN